MNRTRKVFVSTMIAAAGAVSAVALSGTACRRPGAGPARESRRPVALTHCRPWVPPHRQLIQSLATAMSGTPAPAAAPATPPPGATASLTLPAGARASDRRGSCCRPGGRSRCRPAAAPANALSSLTSALPAPLSNAGGLAQLLPSGISLPGLTAPAATAPAAAATAPLTAAAPLAPLAAAPLAARHLSRHGTSRGRTGSCGSRGGCRRSRPRPRSRCSAHCRDPARQPHTIEPWENHVIDQEAVRQRRHRGRLVGGAAVGRDRYRQRRPGGAAADRCRAGAGHVGGGEPQPGDSEGGRRSVQRGVDVDGGRGGVHR